MLAYGEGESRVKAKHMRLAVKDTVETQGIRHPRFEFMLPGFARWIFASACVAVLAVSVHLGAIPIGELLR